MIMAQKPCDRMKGPYPCIIEDLCDRRDIAVCKKRTRWSQGIQESDEDFLGFCMMNPAAGV